MTLPHRSSLLVLWALFGGLPTAAHGQDAPYGYWEGELTLRRDVWPLRLDIMQQAESAAATIDLPELGMAWHPVPVSVSRDAVTLDLPFGLGSISATVDSASLGGRRITVSGDTLRLWAVRREPFSMVRQDVTFSNGPATLHGVFVMPPGRGPFPAVVLVHGSAAQGRHSWAYRSAADFFVRRGFAVLYYDKRGVGASKGPWMTTSFADIADLAADLRVAVTWLQRRPEVDRRRVGVYGGSQALWVSARAAAGGDVGFMIMRGAPAVTPEEQELQRVRHTLEHAGTADSVVQAALEHTRLYFSVVKTGDGWDELVRSVARVRAEPWGEELLQADTRDDLYWWRQNHAFDPVPDLGRLRIPVLLLYGEHDTVVPPSENAPRLAGSLDATLVTVLVFPRANHALEVPAGSDAEGRWRFPRKAPGVFEAIHAWLLGNVLAQHRGFIYEPQSAVGFQ
jgi:alpha-beta hydrolase superfamily lysophospholipase